jgi:hypothetical protein
MFSILVIKREKRALLLVTSFSTGYFSKIIIEHTPQIYSINNIHLAFAKALGGEQL